MSDADFSKSIFGDADFSNSIYFSKTDFSVSKFTGYVSFNESSFSDITDFHGTQFGEDAFFTNSTYQSIPEFGGANIGNPSAAIFQPLSEEKQETIINQVIIFITPYKDFIAIIFGLIFGFAVTSLTSRLQQRPKQEKRSK